MDGGNAKKEKCIQKDRGRFVREEIWKRYYQSANAVWNKKKTKEITYPGIHCCHGTEEERQCNVFVHCDDDGRILGISKEDTTKDWYELFVGVVRNRRLSICCDSNTNLGVEINEEMVCSEVAASRLRPRHCSRPTERNRMASASETNDWT